MVFERTEHEPEEHDPEADFHDPDADSLTIPRVEPPAVREPGADLGGRDVPADVAQTFWIVVIVVNAAVLAVSLGVLLVVFRGETRTGGGLVVGGLVLFGLAYRRYQAFRRRREGDEPATGTASDGEPEPPHDPDP